MILAGKTKPFGSTPGIDSVPTLLIDGRVILRRRKDGTYETCAFGPAGEISLHWISLPTLFGSGEVDYKRACTRKGLLMYYLILTISAGIGAVILYVMFRAPRVDTTQVNMTCDKDDNLMSVAQGLSDIMVVDRIETSESGLRVFGHWPGSGSSIEVSITHE